MEFLEIDTIHALFILSFTLIFLFIHNSVLNTVYHVLLVFPSSTKPYIELELKPKFWEVDYYSFPMKIKDLNVKNTVIYLE